MGEVLTINVRGLHTDTALAVYGGILLTSTNQGSTLWDSSRDDWFLSPLRALFASASLIGRSDYCGPCMVVAGVVRPISAWLQVRCVRGHISRIQSLSHLGLG